VLRPEASTRRLHKAKKIEKRPYGHKTLKNEKIKKRKKGFFSKKSKKC